MFEIESYSQRGHSRDHPVQSGCPQHSSLSVRGIIHTIFASTRHNDRSKQKKLTPCRLVTAQLAGRRIVFLHHLKWPSKPANEARVRGLKQAPDKYALAYVPDFSELCSLSAFVPALHPGNGAECDGNEAMTVYLAQYLEALVVVLTSGHDTAHLTRSAEYRAGY